MINTLLVSDNKDDQLGFFFEECAEHTKAVTNGSFNIVEINSRNLNSISLRIQAESFNFNAFLFISYTHGTDTELLANGSTPFISDTLNVECLKNCFAYCFACHAGNKLGQSLIDNKALAFVGFKSELKIQKYFGAFESFTDCATSGVRYFFSGDNLEISINKMKSKYTECVDQYYSKDMVVASWFMEHRDSLILLGKSDLSIRDFLIP